MKLVVKVRPGSSVEKVVKEGDEYGVWVKEKAIDGKANEAVRKSLARAFGVPVGKITIKTPRARKKIVEIAV